MSLLCRWGGVSQIRNVVSASSGLRTITQSRAMLQSLQRFTPQIKSRPIFSSASRFCRKLPFEVNEKVAKDTLVFSYENDRFYRTLTLFGIVQFFFWFHLGVFAYKDFKKVNKSALEKLDESVWGKLLSMQSENKDKIAVATISVGKCGNLHFRTIMYFY